jgi:hypothetical protein
MRIRTEGFLPKKPSKKVWFAHGHGYAYGRAKTQARRAHDTPVVLKCDIDVSALRDRYGAAHVRYNNGILAVDATISPSVLRSSVVEFDQPQSPGEFVMWVCSLLNLKQHKGPSPKHSGVIRLSEWATRRKAHRPDTLISPREMLGKARQWLPEYFSGFDIDPGTLRARRTTDTPQDDIVSWVCSILQIMPHDGPKATHPGVVRLTEWVKPSKGNRLGTKFNPREMLGKARQWLPAYFDGVEVDPALLRARATVEVPFHTDSVQLVEESLDELVDPHETEALECLLSPKPERRAKGLKMLSDMANIDLFEWCAMYMDDESVDVVVAALRAIPKAQDADVGPILPLADSVDQRIRAAAIAALAAVSGEGAVGWLELGLKDPSVCVRTETCTRLADFDAADTRFHTAFELALYDPHGEIRQRAERLVSGKGYHIATW